MMFAKAAGKGHDGFGPAFLAQDVCEEEGW